MHSKNKNYFFRSYTYNPWWNLAIEQYLIERLTVGEALFYLWQNDRTVVIGRNQNALQECRIPLLESEGGLLARRQTGGGAVYQDLGNICFTFAADPEQFDLKRQFAIVEMACLRFGIRTKCSGRNDIISETGRKFSGSAFSYTGQSKVHHGTLMVDVNLDDMERYLQPSSMKLASKGISSVRSRVCNLKLLNSQITTEKMCKELKNCYEEVYGDLVEIFLTEHDLGEIRKLYERYASWEWRYGKTPECEVSYQTRFSWGEIKVNMKLRGMRIQDMRVYTDMLDADFPQVLRSILLGKKYNLKDIELDRLGNVGADCEMRLRQVVEWLAQIVE